MRRKITMRNLRGRSRYRMETTGAKPTQERKDDVVEKRE